MTPTARKYNPGFLSDDDLVASFCVRMSEFDSMVELLRERTSGANRHQIVLGPRGSGKTTLLLRVGAELRRDDKLAARYFPVVFAEESYEVASAGEFWLECLTRLADQASPGDDGRDLGRTIHELRSIRDDRMLAERCLGALQDFSDREGKRLVLIVENLNMMIRDMADREAEWRLRQTLQTEPRILLLASATSRFDAIDDPDRALYDLFRVVSLKPLDANECARLWRTVSEQDRGLQTIRALRILTGGSPRLLTIVARFGARLSFRELMADLLNLVDDNTEYFKSHLDALPPQERRVYLALAALWKPATTREIAERARLDTSKCSAHLGRLMERGAVEVAGGSARRKLYYLGERLYNIYYLMRRARGPAPLIEALIRFMEGYYSPAQLRELGTRMAREASGSDTETQLVYRAAFARLIELPALEPHREELLSLASGTFLVPADRARSAHAVPTAARELFERGLALAESGRLQEALAVWDDLVRRFETSRVPEEVGEVSMALVNRGTALGQLNRPEEALAAWDAVVRLVKASTAPAHVHAAARALVQKGGLLASLGRIEEALAAWDELVGRFVSSNAPSIASEVAIALSAKGGAFMELQRPDEALAAWNEVVQRFGESDRPSILVLVSMALVNTGALLSYLKGPKEALTVWNEAIERFGSSDSPEILQSAVGAFVNKGIALSQLGREEEALSVWNEVIARFESGQAPVILEQVAGALVNKGVTLAHLGRGEDAIGAWNEVSRRFQESDSPAMANLLATALVHKGTILLGLGRAEEALAISSDVIRRYGTRENPETVEQVALALGNRGAALIALNRPEDAVAAWDEVVRRFGTSDSPTLRIGADMAQLNRALVELALGQAGTAIETITEVLEREGARFPEFRLKGHLVRAKAHLANGDHAECAQDVETSLAILPTLAPLPKEALDALSGLSVDLGPERMRDLILNSPASQLLLPLTTALELEMGMEPRVAKEVEEVAEDIRRAMEAQRERRPG